MTKKKLLIIGTIILLCSTILNTTIEFYVDNKIGELRSEIENKNRLNNLLYQVEMRSALEYELADNLCIQNLSFRISNVKKEVQPHLANFQNTINLKLAQSIIDLKAAINVNKITPPDEIDEFTILARQGEEGYLRLTKIYKQIRDSLTTVRKEVIDNKMAISLDINYWDNIRSMILFFSVIFQVAALLCFTFKELISDK